MISDPTSLQQVFCVTSKFQELFIVKTTVNVTSLLEGICNLNFDTIAERLQNSFNVERLEANVRVMLNNFPFHNFYMLE